jgi:hypothetical protein
MEIVRGGAVLVFAQAQLFTYIEILVLLYGNSTQLFAVKYALFGSSFLPRLITLFDSI